METFDKEFLRQKIATHLDEIAKMFKNPRITLVVRSPDVPDGGIMLSDDDAEKAIAEIRKLQQEANA